MCAYNRTADEERDRVDDDVTRWCSSVVHGDYLSPAPAVSFIRPGKQQGVLRLQTVCVCARARFTHNNQSVVVVVVVVVAVYGGKLNYQH